jgi:hypothetical protein
MSISFTKNEYNIYEKQKNKAKFNNPQEEYEYAESIIKVCSKCNESKNLTCYSGNTSGTDAFDKMGYRLRRPECKNCTKIVEQGKLEAKKIAKQQGILYKAPENAICALCKKMAKKGDGLVFDHSHEKKIFRGYLHNSCNRSLGVLGDDVKGILTALNYCLKDNPIKLIQNDEGFIVQMEID